MIVDYLLIGHKRDGEIKSEECVKGDILRPGVTFEPANSYSKQYAKQTYDVQVIHHLGNRYAVAVALENGEVITAAEINKLIESSGVRPIPEGVIGKGIDEY